MTTLQKDFPDRRHTESSLFVYPFPAKNHRFHIKNRFSNHTSQSGLKQNVNTYYRQRNTWQAFFFTYKNYWDSTLKIDKQKSVIHRGHNK